MGSTPVLIICGTVPGLESIFLSSPGHCFSINFAPITPVESTVGLQLGMLDGIGLISTSVQSKLKNNQSEFKATWYIIWGILVKFNPICPLIQSNQSTHNSAWPIMWDTRSKSSLIWYSHLKSSSSHWIIQNLSLMFFKTFLFIYKFIPKI